MILRAIRALERSNRSAGLDNKCCHKKGGDLTPLGKCPMMDIRRRGVRVCREERSDARLKDVHMERGICGACSAVSPKQILRSVRSESGTDAKERKKEIHIMR